MNKPLYLGLSILELSKILMYEFWYDYVKPEYGKKINLYYMDIDSFFAYIKTDDIFKDIAEDVETRFDTSNYELERPFPKVKNKKVIGLMKDELGGKIMTKFVGLRTKPYSYLIADGSEDKKAKDTKSISKENNKEFIKNNKSILKIQQRFKSERYNVFTEEINKIASSSNDDKRMLSIDTIEIYAYETRKYLESDKE